MVIRLLFCVVVLACTTTLAEVRELLNGQWHYDRGFRDSSGDFWWLMPETNGVWRWDGEMLTPQNVEQFGKKPMDYHARFFEDNQHRVWLAHFSFENSQAHIFDLKTDHIISYPDLRGAVESELKKFPTLEIDGGGKDRIMVKNGRCTLFQNEKRDDVTVTAEGTYILAPAHWVPIIAYFNGNSWNSFTKQEVIPDTRQPFSGLTRLNNQGDLVFSEHRYKTQKAGKATRDTWVYNTAKGWSERLEVIDLPPKTAPKPPRGMHVPISQYKHDEQGDFWVTRDNHIFRYALDTFCQVTEEALERSSSKHPFNHIKYVKIDNAGNRIMHIGAGHSRILVIKTPEGGPDTIISNPEFTPGLSTFRISASAPECKFIWRLNEDEWTKPESLTSIKFEGLEPGLHTLEVLAIGPKLCRKKQPDQMAFTVPGKLNEQNTKLLAAMEHSDTDTRDRAKRILDQRNVDYQQYLAEASLRREFPELILQLQSDDWDLRNRAALKLLNGDENMRTKLEELQQTADDDLAWWLNAVLQKMDEKPAQR